jgi:small conductance mechanosensitive channel
MEGIAELLKHLEIIQNPTLIFIAQTLAVILITYLFIRFGNVIVKQFVTAILTGKKHVNKIMTLSKISVGIYDTAIGFLAAAFFLKFILHVDISAMLNIASISAIAVGWASQNIIQDFMRGITLLLQESITMGDDIEVNGTRGIVEDINLHCIYLRDKDGALHVIPNSKISGYTNYSRPQCSE